MEARGSLPLVAAEWRTTAPDRRLVVPSLLGCWIAFRLGAMKAGRVGTILAVALAGAGLGGCVHRTWEDAYVVKEAAPAVGTHQRRAYKYGDHIPPTVNPRVKIEGEGLRILLEQMRAGGG